MDYRMIDDTCRMVEKEIDSIVSKDELTPTELDQLDKLVDIYKDIAEVKSMDGGGMSQGRSNGRSSYNGASYGYDKSRMMRQGEWI